MLKNSFSSIKSDRLGFVIRISLVSGLGWIYFREIIAILVLLPLAVILQTVSQKQRKGRSQRQIMSQLRDMLISVSASISAGATLENSMKMVPCELAIIWPENSEIIRQIRVLVHRLGMSIPIEKAILEMAQDINIEDCERFAEVVAICKQSGGNLVNAVRSCADALTEKLDALFEIDSILAQRRLERNILVCIPHCMLAVLALMSPDYIEMLYSTSYGRIAAGISLFFSGIAWIVSEKIIDVKV
ncbi:MAG: hypothetical protein WCQ41_05070 [Bacillota bacterium]